ncbi:hypothetical protein LJC16_00885 [Bacteroidales bacterium OttesenSCG-928-C19]|nr:hypothetical protein [Bacteroidales bacterium OttesenSCG-928-C19]
MKKYGLILLLLLFSVKLFSQVNTLGFFERKWSSHSTLEFYMDSTFLENYLSFSCGLYASAIPDKMLRGTWELDGDTLNMKYYTSNNESSFNIQKYLLFDNNNYLIPFGLFDAPYLYYYKTKEYDSKGIEINLNDLITMCDSLPFEKNQIRKEEIRENLTKWILFQNKKTTSDLLINDIDLFNETQTPLIKDCFMLGQIKYSATKKQRKFNELKINMYGLYYLIDFYEQNPEVIGKDNQIDKIILLKEQRKLKKWLKMKINAT